MHNKPELRKAKDMHNRPQLKAKDMHNRPQFALADLGITGLD
jgi:hypothetical protein